MIKLSCGEGLGDNSLQSQFLLLQVVTSSVLNFQLLHGLTQARLNLFLLAPLELHRHCWIGNHILNPCDMCFELLSSLKSLSKCLITGLEFGSIIDHAFNLS